MNQPNPPISSSRERPPAARIISLDQFRGYTVLGMFVVNFLGFFAVTPALLKHHNTYCSYADTIMPQFFFAVGFAYRLVFLRRSATMDRSSVYWRFVRRSLGLILLGAFLYVAGAAVDAWLEPAPASAPPFVVRAIRTELFQALVHIGVTCLWIMPVIAAPGSVRIAFAAGSAGLQVVLSHVFYYHWVMTAPGIDGGPLGFLTWSVPTLAGSLAHDIAVDRARRGAVGRLAVWAVGLMLLGYGLSCLNRITPPNSLSGRSLGELFIEPPFVPPSRPVNYWNMNQRAGSVSYLTFGAGLSMGLYALLVWLCDQRGFQLGVLRTLGTNALAGYVIHMIVDRAIKLGARPDWPPSAALAALALFLAICYGCVRALEKRQIYLRL